MRLRKFGKYILMACLLGAVSHVFAAQDLTKIAGNVEGNVRSLASLLVVVSYIAGIGFALAGLLQFKAHKDNPAQVPLSKPMVYIGVGAALLFLPSILESAGETIFGGDQSSAGQGEGALSSLQ